MPFLSKERVFVQQTDSAENTTPKADCHIVGWQYFSVNSLDTVSLLEIESPIECPRVIFSATT